MRPRLAAAAAALALAAAVFVAGPAQAQQTKVTCKDWSGNLTQSPYHLCITTYWRDDAGPTGITVYEIDVDLSGGPWESAAFSCDAIRMWVEPSDVVKWRRDGAQCDMTNAIAHKDWQLNFPAGLDMTATNETDISIAGYPKFNNNADPGRIVLTQKLTA